MNVSAAHEKTSRPEPVRWGFVGTGTIAGWMANVVRGTPAARLCAVASRNMNSARAFANKHDAGRAFDSWARMLDWDGIDAVYIATPTGLREDIAVAAARAGKHVLAEKPFASLESLRRITHACRENQVCFMDATHFVHHPRHDTILTRMPELIGEPESLTSCFLISLGDRGNIRYDPALEPLGALGDLGWYNMRATLEYLAGNAAPSKIEARLRRDSETGAVIAGEGRLVFADESVSAWRCSFESGGADIGLKLSGSAGTLQMENFVGNDEDGSASFAFGGYDAPETSYQTVRTEPGHSGPALMFEDFASAVADASRRVRWVKASEHTQSLLDAVWRAAACS